MPKNTLLSCSICGSHNVEVRGKYGAMLHTVCYSCGLDNWDQVQLYVRRNRGVRKDRANSKRVEVHRNGRVEYHTVLRRS